MSTPKGHPSKSQRLEEFLIRLAASPNASTALEAYNLVFATINAVEDELSGIPYNPDTYVDDGRMYPPDNRNVARAPRPDLVSYRSARHRTIIGINGAIAIYAVPEQGKPETLIFEKKGLNGRGVEL